jgi:chitinase
MSATGQKAFDMAFILASGSSCAPAWDGTDPVSSDTQVASVINEVRSDGGDVIVSVGGTTAPNSARCAARRPRRPPRTSR